MNFSRTLLFALFVLLNATSCSKDDDDFRSEPSSDFSHLAGSFLCDYESHWSHAGDSESEDFDRLVKCTVVGSELHAEDWIFVIDSVRQTRFVEKTASDEKATIEYTNKFRKVTIHHSFSPDFAPRGFNNYTGIRVNKPNTLENPISGDYLVESTIHNHWLQLDSTGTAAQTVTHEKNTLTIGDHSYSGINKEVHSYYYFNYDGQYKVMIDGSWDEDHFLFSYLQLDGGTYDTLKWEVHEGTRL